MAEEPLDINGQQQCQEIEGQQLQRQPKLRYVLTPSYTMPLGFGDVTAYVSYTHGIHRRIYR